MATTFRWIYCLTFLLLLNEPSFQQQSLDQRYYNPSDRLSKHEDSYNLNQQQVIQTVPKLNLASYGIEFKDRSKITNKIRFQTEDHEENRKKVNLPSTSSPSPVSHDKDSSERLDNLRRLQDSLRELDWEYFDRRRPTAIPTQKPSIRTSTTSLRPKTSTTSSFQIDETKKATWRPDIRNDFDPFKTILDLVNRTFSTTTSNRRKLISPREETRTITEENDDRDHHHHHHPDPTPTVPIRVDCQQECVAKHFLQHYYSNDCRPVFSRDCDCVKYFLCPKGSHIGDAPSSTTAEEEDSNYSKDSYCWLDGNPNKRYSIGQIIPVPNKPCSVCRCQRDHSARGKVRAKIDCSIVIDCPELAFGAQPSRLDCYYAYSHDRCCGEEICPDRLKWDDYRLQKCRYRNQTYRFGEPILLKENRCKRCICNEHWNEFDPESSAESCKEQMCLDNQRQPTRKDCLPIYQLDTCCPVDFVCATSSLESNNLTTMLESKEQNDGVYGKYFRSDESSPNDSAMQSNPRFNCKMFGKQYRLGKTIHISRDAMVLKSTCATCQCKVPPFMTCLSNPQCLIGGSNLVLN